MQKFTTLNTVTMAEISSLLSHESFEQTFFVLNEEQTVIKKNKMRNHNIATSLTESLIIELFNQEIGKNCQDLDSYVPLNIQLPMQNCTFQIN